MRNKWARLGNGGKDADLWQAGRKMNGRPAGWFTQEVFKMVVLLDGFGLVGMLFWHRVGQPSQGLK